MYPGYDLHSEVQTQNPNYQFKYLPDPLLYLSVK